VFTGHLPELIIVLVLALVVFGPKRLPEIGGAMGKGIREFRRGTQDLENRVMHGDDVRTTDTPAQISRDRDAG
jgi:sec-independent protein translocase protein TatA